MTEKEHLYYGLGMVAYAVARADGEIQAAEKLELQHLLSEWAKHMERDFDVSSIIFKVINSVKPRLDDGFELGMKYIALGNAQLDERTKERFIYLIKDIAHAYPGVTTDERALAKRFEKALANL